jgi:hypothetical protein
LIFFFPETIFLMHFDLNLIRISVQSYPTIILFKK